MKKYNIEISAEKKIIVGKAWKARMKPSDFCPVSSVWPGGMARGPKTNLAPVEAESRRSHKPIRNPLLNTPLIFSTAFLTMRRATSFAALSYMGNFCSK